MTKAERSGRKGQGVVGDRPPSFPSKATLAAELEISEDTVDSWVERGILPQPIRCGRTPRWSWAEVQAMLTRASQAADDRFMEALRDVR